MNLDDLEEIAVAYRATLERVLANRSDVGVELSSFPGGACEITSIMLGHYLQELGVKDVKKVTASRNFRDYAYEDERYSEQGHVWLIINNGTIIDITADQFDDFDQPVYVADISGFHETFTIKSRKDIKNELLKYPYADIFSDVKNQLIST